MAVVVAPPPMTEAKLLGNTRLSVVSREARALGVQAGQTIAQARARAGDLAVRVVRPNEVQDVLARLAEIGLAFGATVSFSAHAHSYAGGPNDYGDIVWVDVTGCAHLHATSSIFDGETLLASRLAGVIGSLGHTCAVAVADGPRVAAMLACASASSRLGSGRLGSGRLGSGRLGSSRSGKVSHLPPQLEPIIVPPGGNAAALASLPVSVLPLTAEDVRWLTKIGVRTIEELRALPREGLGLRLDSRPSRDSRAARAREVLSLAFGEDRAPLAPYVPPEVPEETIELEYGIEGNQALTFVTKTLTDRLASRLRGRGVAAARVELELRLDAAMLPASPASSSVERVELDLPAPLSAANDLLAALRPKIERLVLRAPVLAAKLRTPVLVPQRALALSLFEARPRAERALPRLVAELSSDLGEDAVASLVLGDSWIPEERSRLVPFKSASASSSSSSNARPAKKLRHLVSSVPEPTRLLTERRVLDKDSVRITRHLARVESTAWWHRCPDKSAGRRRLVDYVQAWVGDGVALVEIERGHHDGPGVMFLRGWFD